MTSDRPILICFDGSDAAAQAIAVAGELFPGHRAVIAHVGQGQDIERTRGYRTGRTIIGAALAVPVKVIAVPTRRRLQPAQIFFFDRLRRKHTLTTCGARQQA